MWQMGPEVGGSVHTQRTLAIPCECGRSTSAPPDCSTAHWVESEPGTEGRGDEGFIRYIPFDRWLASKILGEGLVGVRLAPREPLVRDAIVCSVCGLHVGSPAENPAYWVNQFGAAVQCAVGAPAFTCYDCMRSPMESEWSPWFRA